MTANCRVGRELRGLVGGEWAPAFAGVGIRRGGGRAKREGEEGGFQTRPYQGLR